MTFEDLQKANESLKTIDIKDKDYVQVNERIKAFRMLYPEGTIDTEMLSNDGTVCVFKATVSVNGDKDTAAVGDTYTVSVKIFFGKGICKVGNLYHVENSCKCQFFLC